MKRPQRELSIGVWVNNSQILAPKPVPGNLGSTGLNEHPTFEYLQHFFGIKPKDKPQEEPPSGRNSYWY